MKYIHNHSTPLTARDREGPRYVGIYIYVYIHIYIQILIYVYVVGGNVWGGYAQKDRLNHRSLLQNIVSFIGLFCKRDL